MKAIILSAGQGSRLLPLTETLPKCLLPIGGRTVIEHQIDGLRACGIEEIAVVTGFATSAVERCLTGRAVRGLRCRTIFNPFFNVADNLASCWMARGEMGGNFLLLNGDTLFEPAICERLLAAPPAAVTLATNRKTSYDSDDMKVRVDGTRLLEVGKTLDPQGVDGESIGMTRFHGDGPRQFVEVIDQIMRTTNGLGWWYLKAIGVLAERGVVETRAIDGLRWCEIDFPHDLDNARRLFALANPHGGAGRAGAERIQRVS